MVWSARPSMPAGHKVTASDWDAVLDQLELVSNDIWTSYTPTWTANGGGNSIGNGTLEGRYRKMAGSSLVIFEFRQLWGSTTANGTGFYSWSTPHTLSADSTKYSVGSAALFDTGVIRRPAVIRPNSTTVITVESDAGTVSNTVPWTWGTGDEVRGQIMYSI